MKPTVSTLKNGLTVITAPQKGAASTTVYVFCRVGSRYESKDINGASHFIEHLAFKGTKRRSTTQVISRELDRYGAYYNAYTGKDQTAYYIKIDAEHAGQAIDLLHDMVFKPLYLPEEIERERGVIVEEINMYDDNPQMAIDSMLEEALFSGSSLGWDIAGPKSVIRNISRDRLIAYRDRYYIPSRTAVAISGVIPKNLDQLLAKTFGKIPMNRKQDDSEYAAFSVKGNADSVLNYREKKTEQTQVAIGFYGCSHDQKEEPAAKLLSIILGGYMSSRLFIEVRERRGLCYSIGSMHEAFSDTGLFSIYAGLDKKRLPLAMKTIFDELTAVKEKGVTTEELARAKDHLHGKIALAFEDSGFQANWYGKQWLMKESPQSPEERLKELDAVTRKQIQKAACQLLDSSFMACAVIGDHGERSTLEKNFKWE